jgi:hypothetical protein
MSRLTCFMVRYPPGDLAATLQRSSLRPTRQRNGPNAVTPANG